METELINEFINQTGANSEDALKCLKTWSWDIKKALIDYNGKFLVIYKIAFIQLLSF